jgi:holo-[acyl-carrier protein] synthase
LGFGAWRFFGAWDLELGPFPPMSIIGIGVDLVECARIQHSLDRFGDRFLHRVFTDGEIAYSKSMKFPARHLAARFAAKEALSKAFGTGIGGSMGWKDIDVRKKPSGEPFVVLEGGAKQLANDRGVTKVLITLSHTDNHAMAMIVLES